MFGVILNYSYSNNLENFFRTLEKSPTVKLKVNFIQKYYDKNFESFGDFYILGHREYFFDSSDFEIYADSNHTITKNNINRQIIYNESNRDQLDLFNILSGERSQIEFSDANGNTNKYEFSISTIGIKGYFLFEPGSELLSLIHFEIGLNQYVTINIFKIEILDNFLPKINLDNFEIIDLRG